MLKDKELILDKTVRKRNRGSFINSVWLALQGTFATFRLEKHFRFHLFFAILVYLMAVFFRFTSIEWLFLHYAVFLVLIVEMINTAIEVNVDLATKQQKLRAKLAKDIAAGAVLLSVINAMIVGVLLFVPKIWYFGQAMVMSL